MSSRPRARSPSLTSLTVAGDPGPASNDVRLLLEVLPQDLKAAALTASPETLIEIVMDLGRPAEARFPDRAVRLAERAVGHEDLAHVLSQIGEFTEDNRAGIARTLHRISTIRNRKTDIVGLTLRVGRAVFGTIDLVRDLVETGRNLLILGRPGVGKTTKLREAARVLADDSHKRVIVIDTSNEIAGDGDVPHPGIGGERRVRGAGGRIREEPVAVETPEPAPVTPSPRPRGAEPIRIHPYALSRDSLERVIRDLRLNARAVARPESADMILALRSRADDARLGRLRQATGLPLHVIKSNTTAQMRRVLQNVFNLMQGVDENEVQEAVREAEHAIQRVLSEGAAVALAPRRPTVRKMQHRIIARYRLEAESQGREPLRHLVIHPRP